ncbi:MAG: response regulator [Desulfovibrionaceae bacterium]|nr:response regulator [Desulfovibrionaceae bacterium]
MRHANITKLTEILSKKPISILIAEDSLSNQDLLALYFRKTACVLDFADNGSQAVEKFKSNRYDMVLMDIFMPVMDGLDATREIRAFEQQDDRDATPVVAVTASAFEEDRQQAIDAGCTGFLTKPIRKADIFGCVAETVGGTAV